MNSKQKKIYLFTKILTKIYIKHDQVHNPPFGLFIRYLLCHSSWHHPQSPSKPFSNPRATAISSKLKSTPAILIPHHLWEECITYLLNPSTKSTTLTQLPSGWMEDLAAHLCMVSYKKSVLITSKMVFITRLVINSHPIPIHGIKFQIYCSFNPQLVLVTQQTRTHHTNTMTWTQQTITSQLCWAFSKIILSTPRILSGSPANLMQVNTFQISLSELMLITEKTT